MLQWRIFQWREDNIQVLLYRILGYTKVFMNIGAAWLQEDSSFNWLTKIQIRLISSTRRKEKILSYPSLYLFLAVVLNQKSDPLLSDGFQCCCDIHNCPILKLIKLRRLACGDTSQENFHYSIQEGGVIMSHVVETWIEQGGGGGGGGKGWCFHDITL